ncbi:MAG: glycosyltransferase [Phycisphaerales bacterium]|nr:glycosyltransferase [Phycisphaerales bacterium]
MTALVALGWVVFAGLSLILIWWIVVVFRLVRMLRTGLSVLRGLDETPDETTLVSVVIPAHNEERVLERCLKSVLAQDWPALEVIVALDRCIDGSEAIVLQLAEQDERLKIVRIDACPPTWAGKCNAASQGVSSARGDWLLMLDADTNADPKLVRALLGEAIRRDAALLSLLTDLDCSAWFERAFQPVAMMVLMQSFPPDRVNRDERNRPFANGQCMLFQRSWYEAIGGHGAVKDDLLEDIMFSKVMDQSGGRVRVLSADGLLSCSMYGDWADFRRGWTRIYLESCGRNVDRLGQVALRQEVLGAAPPVLMAAGLTIGVVTGTAIFWIMAAITLLVQWAVLFVIYSRSRQPLWCTLLFPMGCFEVARAHRRARRLLLKGEPVKWGGRAYVLEPR